MILDQLFTADSLAESVPGQTRTPYDIGGADAWYHRGSHPEQFDNDEDRAEYLRGYQDEGVTGRHQGKQYDLDETNSLTTRAADPRIQEIGRRMIELNQLYAQAQRMKDDTLVNKIKQALSRLAAEKLRLQGTAPADMAEGLEQDYLSQVPNLTWKPVSRSVWNTIQDEGLDEEQDAPKHTDWIMASLIISSEDARALQAFDSDVIEDFNRFDIHLKSRHPGLTDLIDYDNGTVTIVKPSQMQGVAEGLEQISIKARKGHNKFATELSVDGKTAGVYQYDANSGRSIAEVYPEYRGKGFGKILVLHAIYTAAKLGMDFVEDESRTAEYDNVLDSLDNNGLAVNDDGYWYVTGEGEQYLKQRLKQGVAEAGPFSYGSKAPRKGSVADLAAKKRKEQQKGKQPVEPKDQMVGVAKVITKGVAEATGDVKFDKMLKGITAKKAVAKQRKADTQQQARDAFGGMFGGGNPADKLGLGKKDVSEAQPTRRTMPWSVWNAKSADDQRFIRSQYPDLVITDRPRPKSPAAPKKEKIDYAEIARKIQEIVGNTFPDGDPIDWLIPYMRRRWGQEYNIGQHLDRAARRHLGARDYTDYLAQMWDQVADDDLMPDHVTHDNNPWRAREGMAEASNRMQKYGQLIIKRARQAKREAEAAEKAKRDAEQEKTEKEKKQGVAEAKADPLGAWIAHKNGTEARRFKTREGAKKYAASHEGFTVNSSEGFHDTYRKKKDVAVDEGRWFRTSYGWAGGRNEKTGKMYKHPELYKKAQDKRAKRDAESGAVDKPEKDTALSETKLVGIMRHPEHGKAYIWHKGGEGGHNYEVEHARTKQKETHHKSHEEVVAGLKKQGYRLDESDLERFHKSLGQQIRDRVAQTQADVAIARAKDPGTWQWNKGDQVYSKKTGKVYTIQGQTMNPKFGAMYWYQRGREGRNGFERGQFIASLAHETLTKVNEDALSESEQYLVLYIDGRAVAKYKETHPAQADLERLQSKFPQKNIELKTEMLEAAVAEGLRDPADNPCWKGYYPVGTKKKNGRTVPNCVPKK